MKLLFVIGSFFPAQSGGPNNTIYWQVKELVKHGYDVTVITTMQGITNELKEKYKIIPNKMNKIDGINVIYFDFYKKNYVSFNFYKWLFKNVSQFNLVNLTSYFFPMSWISAFICNIKKIDFSLAPRGELEDNALIYNRFIKKIFIKLFLKKLFNNAKFIIVTSSQELNFSKRFFRKDMIFKILPNYIELPKNLEINIKNKKDILYLGRLHPKKGIENLIKAYLMLDSNLKNKYKLKIVGSGNKEYIDYLKSLINEEDRENVFFLGHKEGKEKENLYKLAKVFVLPSYSENFGNVVLESLMYKTPVISSVYTPWEELDEYKCGYWVDNKPEEIKKYLEKILLLDFKQYEKICENAFNFVKEKYSVQKNIQKIIKVYNG